VLCVIDQLKGRRRRRSAIELTMIKEIASGLLQSLEFLESIHVLHTDIKPENVLCAFPDPKVAELIALHAAEKELDADLARSFVDGDEKAPIVSLADFGLSMLLEPLSTTNPQAQRVVSRKELNVRVPGVLANDKGTLIQTREYRAPEVLFGTDYNCRTDIWSVGCMVYELITGDFLMDPKKKQPHDREMDVEHVAQVMQILGPVPHAIAAGDGKLMRRYFDKEGRFMFQDKYKAYRRRSIAVELEVFLEPAEAERAAQFIMSCFTYDPFERCHPADLRKHSWLRSCDMFHLL
jgi:serine/threonine protein kinase